MSYYAPEDASLDRILRQLNARVAAGELTPHEATAMARLYDPFIEYRCSKCHEWPCRCAVSPEPPQEEPDHE